MEHTLFSKSLRSFVKSHISRSINNINKEFDRVQHRSLQGFHTNNVNCWECLIQPLGTSTMIAQ